MNIQRILVADDEILIRKFLEETLSRKNKKVVAVENGFEAIEMMKRESFDLVITDMKMPKKNGLDVLRFAKNIDPNLLVIIITAFGSIENAVEAVRLGAFNYLIKPFSPDAIETILEKAEEHLSLLHENTFLRQEISENYKTKEVIAESPTMKKILRDIGKIAKSNASVFIDGESGTGKEVIASVIHSKSNRFKFPFVKVNCAAIPDSLIESEFFGHEKGAFTGAIERRLGRFELASKGTLLLDEVTEIPSILQPKLLRAIQEKEFERVGGTKPIHVDVRIISTSNRDMKEAIQKKIFREDLYYRLNVMPIFIPPLRERKEDILPFANYFLKKFCAENHKLLKKLKREASQKLLNYPWPGNVRELANIIERMVVMDFGIDIEEEHLYLETLSSSNSSKKNSKKDAKKEDQEDSFAGIPLREVEKKLILETLNTHNQNRTRTAKILGISVRTLRNKLKEYRQVTMPEKSQDTGL